MLKPHFPGPCVRIQYTPTVFNAKDASTYIIPVSDDFVVTSQQETSRPIMELFKELKNMASSAIGTFGGSSAQAIFNGVTNITDLLGYRLGGKAYYTTAWKGAKENSFNLKLNFKLGWTGGWDAKEECVAIAYDIMGKTLPWTGSKESYTLTSPMPAPIDVYARFGTTVISSAIADISNGASVITKTVTGISWTAPTDVSLNSKNTTSLVDTLKNNAQESGTAGNWLSITANGPRTWNVEFGFYTLKGGFHTLLDMGPNVVHSSSITQSLQMQSNKDGKFYPVSVELTLDMIAQDVYTSSLFVGYK